MSTMIPIPKKAIEISKQMQASNVINKMRLENILLKHLVSTIDPEHDYHMDLDNMELTKVKKNVEVPSSDSKGTPERRADDIKRKTEELLGDNDIPFRGRIAFEEGDGNGKG